MIGNMDIVGFRIRQRPFQASDIIAPMGRQAATIMAICMGRYARAVLYMFLEMDRANKFIRVPPTWTPVSSLLPTRAGMS